jgi:HK97 family phage prohead protease
MEKKRNSYGLKNLDLSIKDLDLGKREVAMYLSKFDNIDSDMDMIVKGAFARSIAERGVESESNRKIAFLRYHDWQHQIGKFVKLEEDETGLFAVAKLGTSTKGEDALRDYDEDIIKEHSIGFQYIWDKMEWVEDESVKGDGYYRIEEVKLFEGSAVTLGANEETPVLGVQKSANPIDDLKKIEDEISIVTKALINGRGTDDRLYNLEMKLKYLNARLVDHANNAIKSYSKLDRVKRIDNTPSFDWNKVNKLLTSKD